MKRRLAGLLLVLVASALMALGYFGWRGPAGGESAAPERDLTPQASEEQRLEPVSVLARASSEPEGAGPQSRMAADPHGPGPAGHAGWRVTGRVVDALGEPVEHVRIRLAPVSTGRTDADAATTLRALASELGARSREQRTDSEGRYALERVGPGLYDLGVSLNSMGGGGLDPVARRVEIDADLEHDFRLAGALVLAGRVTQAFEAPVKLELAPASPRRSKERSYAWGGLRQVVPGADGQFRFTGLEPGFYLVRAASRGHGHTSFEFELEQSITDAHLVLERGLTLAGRIEVAYLTEDPRVWVEVELRGTSDYFWNRNSGWGDGSFRFENLPPGTYELEVQGLVQGERERRIWRELTVHLEQDLVDYHYRLEDDVEAQIAVRLPAGAALANGTLTARNGEQLRTTRVRLSSSGSGTRHEQWPDTSHVFVPWASFYESAALELSVPPGTWDARLEVLGYEPWSRRLDLHAAQLVTAVLEPLPGRLLLADYDSRAFRVERRASGSTEPWELTVWHDSHVPSHSPPEGLEQAWLALGTYDFRITTDDHVERTVPGVVLAVSAEPFVIDFPLEAGVSIQGTTVSPAGEAVHSSLRLDQLQSGHWVRLEWRRDFGAPGFHFRGLVPGTYRATLDRAGEVEVGRWEVGDTDLLDQVIVVQG